jgi:hypothetical protein
MPLKRKKAFSPDGTVGNWPGGCSPEDDDAAPDAEPAEAAAPLLP